VRYFGTDGIRGEANKFPLVPEFLVKLGKATVTYFDNDSRAIILAGDTRQSTTMIASALSSGIVASGCDVLELGIAPTPVLAYFTRILKAKCGIMVTASHNPWQDNGVKFYKNDGTKLSEHQEENFEKLIDLDINEDSEPGAIHPLIEWQEDYIAHLKTLFDLDLASVEITLDCANGPTSFLAPMVFEAFNAKPKVIHNAPDGKNINENCGATSLNNLKKERQGVGIAFDGDGDRVIMIDELGNTIDGDHIMGIIAVDLKEENKLQKDSIVITKYSNMGLRVALWEKGVKVDYADNGDQYVSALMKNHGYSLGGEKTGHIILSEYETTGNGIIVALKVLEIMKKKNKKLHELNFLKEYPQILINVEVKEKIPIENLPNVILAIEGVESKLGDNGRVFVRYSGTQNLVRIMIEGQDKDLIRSYADKIAEEFKQQNSTGNE